MTDPKNPETKPEGQAPAPSSKPYISSRLREKLSEGGDAEWTPKGSNPLPGIAATIVLVGILVLTIVWVVNNNKKQEAAKAEAARQAAIADSLDTLRRADSLAAVVRADSTARADSILAHGGKLPKPGTPPTPTASAKPASPAAKPAAGATASATPAEPAAKPAPATDGFGIAVGQYMLESRANDELAKFGTATGLTGKVVPVDDGGTTMYRVILGKWSSRGAADKKATALIDSSLVHEARVVARPK